MWYYLSKGWGYFIVCLAWTSQSIFNNRLWGLVRWWKDKMCRRAPNATATWIFVIWSSEEEDIRALEWADLQFVRLIRPVLNICVYAFMSSKCFPDLPVSVDRSFGHSSEETFDLRRRSTSPLSQTSQKPLLGICEWKVKTLTFDFSFLSTGDAVVTVRQHGSGLDKEWTYSGQASPRTADSTGRRTAWADPWWGNVHSG